MVILALLVAAAAVILYIRLRKIEVEIERLRRDVEGRLDRMETAGREEFKKERHMLNESLAAISETLMQAVISRSDGHK